MATLAQIREGAAENLGILAEGEELPSYESADLGRAYTELYSELEILGLTNWSQTANVPDQYSWAITILTAEKRAVKYRVPAERYQQIKLEANQALALLRKLLVRSKLGQTKIENF